MSDFSFLRKPVEECWGSSKRLQIRNLSNRNDENLAAFGGRRGGSAFASTLPQQCLPPRIPLSIAIIGVHMGLVVCCIKVSK